jgi:hypothetical protein
MARVQYGSIITEIRGSIGGISFQSNANSKFARLKFARHRKNSVKQNTQITVFQQQLPLWAELSQNSKNDWNDFAAAHQKEDHWGELRTLSGFQYFISIANNLAIVGESPLSSPPVWETPLVIPDYDGQFVPDDSFINFLEEFEHENHYILMFSSPLLRTVSLANRKVLRFTKLISPGSTTTFDFQAEWCLTHNLPVPIPGDPVEKSIFVALMSIHKDKGLASAFNSIYVTYEPD